MREKKQLFFARFEFEFTIWCKGSVSKVTGRLQRAREKTLASTKGMMRKGRRSKNEEKFVLSWIMQIGAAAHYSERWHDIWLSSAWIRFIRMLITLHFRCSTIRHHPQLVWRPGTVTGGFSRNNDVAATGSPCHHLQKRSHCRNDEVVFFR